MLSLLLQLLLLIFLVACYLVCLRFPFFGLLLHSCLAVYLLWPIAVAFREHKWKFYLRHGRARFRPFFLLRWISNTAIALQLASLGLLFFFLSCRCSQDPIALLTLPTLTGAAVFVLLLLGRRQESLIQLSRYAFLRLTLLLGLAYSLSLQLLELIHDERGLLGKLWLGLTRLFSFLRGIARQDLCEAYRGLDGSIEAILSLPPRPISTILKVFLQSEIAFGFLMSLYVIACLKLFRIDDHQPLDESQREGR